MQVIDPRKRQPIQKREKPKRGLLIISVAFVVIFGAVIGILQFTSNKTSSKKVQQSQQQQSVVQNIEPITKTGKLKVFTGQQFKELYNSFAYPNTQSINESTPITGNEVADARIRQIAINRGYLIRSAPVSNAFQNVGEDYLLQQRAAQPWLDLVEAAKKDGISIGLSAAYRSAEDQKQIFLGRLAQQNVPIEGIASGAYDGQVSEVLRTTAVPGYSRHHTGYTIDIACKDMPNTSFMYTNCFKWLSADNYKVAKEHGWIPSYPEGAGNQGPDPESWEYVWVGKDALTE